MNNKILIINELDNVSIALEQLDKDFSFPFGNKKITVLSDIEKGHKVALKNINKDENIIKYAFPIGHATCDIPAGSHVHSHNMRTNLKGFLEYSYSRFYIPELQKSQTTFMGYKRENGKIGIRNEIWIINTVGCVNKVSERLAQEANKLYQGRIDGIYTFVHPYGCSQLGDDLDTTRRILAGLVNHPNAAGVLLMGLGCENNNIASFKQYLMSSDNKWNLHNKNRVKFLEAQNVSDEIGTGLSMIEELVEYAEGFEREQSPVSSLVVGLKCGGSDAFSGITANPVVGSLSDLIIEHGGSTILTEVPEMFGAETIFLNRCINENVFNKMVELINNFKKYFIKHNQPIYENPSPGNKDGGITTLEEKSLGCTYKGGTSPVVNVLNLGEPVKDKGLNILNGPGNDIVSVTNLTASGAHIILFTTGRGTPLGAPVPTLKISSNTEMYKTKPNWIDYNAGALMNGIELNSLTRNLFDLIIKVASGKAVTKNEKNGFREISIFKDGVTL